VYVLQLQLSVYNLTGSIPQSVSDLTHLEVFELPSNDLRGCIPESVGLWSALQSLDLSSNQLTGTISSDLGGMVHLTTLDLSSNRLRGTIPANLGQLAQLSSLKLTANLLNGTISSNLGQLRQLTELSLDNNYLSGTIPDSLGQLSQLTSLYLSRNHLTGAIASTLGDLERVTDLDLSSNHLSGSIPGSLGKLTQLTVLYLDTNQLAGTIPGSLGNLTQLTELQIFSNHLSGPIPDSFGQLTQLTILRLHGNQLNGTIPNSLGNLTQVNLLDIHDNSLGGTIPGTIEQMARLTLLSLYGNQLTGTIPSSLGQLHALTALYLENNNLRGAIPPSLEQLTHLIYLYLAGNQLTGTIPDFLGQLGHLVELSLGSNLLRGTIPGSLAQLSRLRDLLLSDNKLTSTIPSNFGQLTELRYIYLYDNKLTGTIPDSLAAFSRLYDLGLDNNQLSGTLPGFLFLLPEIRRLSFPNNGFSGTLPEQALNGTASHLQILFCESNLLTGTLPDSVAPELLFLQLWLSDNQFSGSISSSFIMALRSIDFLLLDNNQLTGPIPQNWSASASTLQYLYLQGNDLSGPIPESLGHLSVLQNMNLSSNHLTGTIPVSFQQLRSLQVLMLHNNQLRGSIANLFSPLQTVLSTVQLSNNQLTGSLPAAAFLLPSLSSFAAVDNCFDSPLPEGAICSSTNLTALVLDGLHSASSCKHSASAPQAAFKLGPLPSCLLSMPSLATLHLSGSGLTGSLPADANISAVLTDLSLSHNLLTGEIPPSILERDWDKLDLSYNRLTGTLHSARGAPYSNATSLYLQHNRLSGVIPGSMQRVNSLSLLLNNLFSCRVDHSDVPQHDSDIDKYTCGSDAVNNALYAWLGGALAVVVIAGMAAYSNQVADHFCGWFGAVRDAKLRNLLDLFQAANAINMLGMGSAGYCAVILLPVYSAVNSYHPSLTYKYAWTVSGVFLTGTTAFTLEAVFLLLQLPLCAYVAEWLLLRAGQQPFDGATADGATIGSSKTGTRNTLAVAAVTLLSLVVVTGINAGFVVATLNLNGRQLTAIQILLALFKLGFNNFAVPALENRVRMRRIGLGVSSSQLTLVLLNVLVIPCLVVLVISPACFYDALKGTDAVTSSYDYSGDCLSFQVTTDELTGQETLTCAGAQTATESTAYTPHFTYSYQCSSSFVTSYAPTFVIMCIISGFVIPAYHVLLVWLRRNLSHASRLYTMLNAVTPRILRELPSPQDLAQACSHSLHRPAFDSNKLVMSLLTYLALLLTFGALFPPLAVCCAVAMASVVLTARLELGRYVNAAVAADRQDCLDEVESVCAGVTTPQQLRMALYLILAVSCVFYTLFLFDTLGYEVGFAGAFWVLIVVPLLPVVAWALYAAAGSYSKAPPTGGNGEHIPDPEVGVALADIRAVKATGGAAEAGTGDFAKCVPHPTELFSANPMHTL
jgi:Leucine-rich repeat (LRR) protein